MPLMLVCDHSHASQCVAPGACSHWLNCHLGPLGVVSLVWLCMICALLMQLSPWSTGTGMPGGLRALDPVLGAPASSLPSIAAACAARCVALSYAMPAWVTWGLPGRRICVCACTQTRVAHSWCLWPPRCTLRVAYGLQELPYMPGARCLSQTLLFKADNSLFACPFPYCFIQKLNFFLVAMGVNDL